MKSQNFKQTVNAKMVLFGAFFATTLLFSGLCECVAVKDFIVMNKLHDGEIETRVHFRKITAKETSSAAGKEITIRQLTNNKHFIQLIYEGSVLKDCEYVKRRREVVNFVEKFKKEVEDLRKQNVTITPLDMKSLRNSNYTLIPRWLDFHRLKSKCHDIHRLAQERRKQFTEHIGESFTGMITPLKEAFIAPGTYWCGYSDKAEKYGDLGSEYNLDKCCRRHDHCKLIIPGMTNRWGMWNISPFTMSHCGCDNSFRACLKLSDSSAANMVGKLFFNVVQTQCFVLKSKRVCKKRAWWGNKCEKFGYKKIAYLRNNVPY